MKKPLVSIIIPAHNEQDYIQKTLDSVLNQTYTNLEVIIVDDGSTDETKKRVLANKDKRLFYLYKKKGGVGSARNVGIRHATGDILTFLDADDLLNKNAVQESIKCLNKNPDCNVCYSYVSVLTGSRLTPMKMQPLIGNVYNKIRKHFFLACGSNAFLKKEAVLFYDTNLVIEDWDYFIRVAKNNHFCCTKKYLIMYRKHRHNRSDRFSFIYKTLTELFDKPYYADNAHLIYKARYNLLRNYLAQTISWNMVIRPIALFRGFFFMCAFFVNELFRPKR